MNLPSVSISKPSSSDKGKSGKKSGKKKKKKGNRLQRLREKKAKKILDNLNKLVNQYKAEQAKYDCFVARIDKWFNDNSAHIISLFSKFDVDKRGELTYEQFKAGMIDVSIPCNFIELHLLTTLLDEDGNGVIDYAEFTKGVRYFREVEASASKGDEEDNTIQLLGTGEVKWVKLYVKFVLFESEANHPGHFTEVMPLTTYISSLANIIRSHTHLLSMDIVIYSDNSRSEEARLNPHKTIKEYGFHGGPSYDPRELNIYYDYFVGEAADPILHCDFYFTRKRR